ncbi:ABC transporter ATP-binding protein [Marinicrinis sediminis]|uniref:ABC transporter ATP-binding protein n=1 Tax=Marinicrinis sediminis TaxID=1652465 RepID=A0ABW5REB1_9BACL
MSIQTSRLTLGYGEQTIIENLDLEIPKGKITVLIGSNGCGKSTLLRSLSRLLKPNGGTALLEGADIWKTPTKQLAKQMSILPQGPSAPEGITVLQLVRQGRYPHRSFLKPWSEKDEKIVNDALAATKLTEFKHREVDSLSGGQRQRAWIAMTLAQDTETILLDEPTTYLDLTHQIEILDLLFEMNEKHQRTIVMVLHDINLACRYADYIVAVKNKCVFASGKPEEIIQPEMIRQVFDMKCQIMCDPVFGTPMCIPFGRGRSVPSMQMLGASNA